MKIENQKTKSVPKVALAGNPNCGKTALFNALTGGRAKVGNYPGVTVERKEGSVTTPQGLKLSLLDLPGTYSLTPRTPDETITRDVLCGKHADEKLPDLILAVADATNLDRSLAFVLELVSLGQPIVLALNMMDLAHRRKLVLDGAVLAKELHIPVVSTVATEKQGLENLLDEIQKQLETVKSLSNTPSRTVRERFLEVDRILKLATRTLPVPAVWTDRLDRIVLHPLWGSLILGAILMLVFQAVFTWAQLPMEWIENAMESCGQFLGAGMETGPLKSLLIDGILAGVGSVVVFLPQILLLFLFILVLEDSGYMSRAAFLMDRLMGRVGLHGKAFIPLLSSFACAIPGIMSTRTIENRRDRLITILIAPLMACSARLPVYSLLIAAFIPNRLVFGFFRLQGLVMFGLYLLGVGVALLMAIAFKKTILPGPPPSLLMELPTYKWPKLKNIGIGLMERAALFLKRAGTVILSISVLLWFLASYPKPPPQAEGPAISYSYAGKLGHWMEPFVRPIGFNWKIAVALIPGFMAREVMVGSLATVYALEEANGDKGSEVSPILGERLARDWSLATAMSLLVWYVLACQCISTLAVTRRETHSWRWPAFMLIYMNLLAYFASWVTYQIFLRIG